MKVKNLHVLAGLGGSLLLTAGASAAITGITAELQDFSGGYELADGSTGGGTTATVGGAFAAFDAVWDVYRLWATVDSALSTVGGIGGSVDNNIDFIIDAGDGGVFYNHPVFDSDSSQNPALFNAFPTAAFDTFVTIGVADGSSSPLITEPNNEFNGFQSSISCQNCGWTTTPAAGFGVVSDGDGGLRVLLGQFTVMEGSVFSGQGNVAGGGQIVFDTWGPGVVPAPGALALLGVAGLAGSRRRRA